MKGTRAHLYVCSASPPAALTPTTPDVEFLQSGACAFVKIGGRGAFRIAVRMITMGRTGAPSPAPTAEARVTMATTLDTTDAATTSAEHAAWGQRVLALARISIGFVFLWAFLDKMFALGKATPSGKGWLFGAGEGNPTKGFLSSVEGPFAGFYNSIAGAAWANWLFMLGLLCIGVALLLGLAMRLAAITGAILLVLMWTASLPIATNPFMDDHLVYALVIVGLWLIGNGHVWGAGGWWDRTVGDKVAFLK